MGAGLILGGLVLLCLLIFGWLWLCAGFRDSGWRGVVGKLALQLSAVCLVYGMLRGQPLLALFSALFPPLAVVEVVRSEPFFPFIRLIVWGVAPYAGLALAVSLAIGSLRVWGLGITLIVALLAGLIVGDAVSQTAMCAAAAKRGFDRFDRSSFAASLADAPQPFQLDLHAKAVMSGQSLGWSYRTMDWYVIPPTVVQNVAGGGPYTCPAAR